MFCQLLYSMRLSPRRFELLLISHQEIILPLNYRLFVLIELNVNYYIYIYLIGYTHILLNINLTTFSVFHLKVGKSIVKHIKKF